MLVSDENFIFSQILKKNLCTDLATKSDKLFLKMRSFECSRGMVDFRVFIESFGTFGFNAV